MRRLSLLCLVVASLAVLAAAPVLAGAGGKPLDYAAQGESSSGFSVPGVISVFGTESEAETTNEGTHARSSASPITVLDQPLHELAPGLEPTGVSCEATGEPKSGEVRDERSEALLDIDADVVSVAVLPSECRARAVQENNAMANASQSVVEAEVADAASAAVLTGESDTKTTSGQSRADSRFAVADATVLGTDVTALECTAHASESRGASKEEQSTTVLAVGDAGIDAPLPLPLCSAEAQYEVSGP